MIPIQSPSTCRLLSLGPAQGCDLLTIAPALLEELEAADGEVARRLDPSDVAGEDAERLHLDEQAFRWMLNEDAMATEKLAEGIRNFTADLLELERHVQAIIDGDRRVA